MTHFTYQISNLMSIALQIQKAGLTRIIQMTRGAVSKSLSFVAFLNISFLTLFKIVKEQRRGSAFFSTGHGGPLSEVSSWVSEKPALPVASDFCRCLL